MPDTKFKIWEWLAENEWLLGLIVGAVIGYVATILHERRQRAQESRDVASALYHELADRAARCVNDYIFPWEQFHGKTAPNPNKDILWLTKFRPYEPTIYPGLTDKLGHIEPETLGRLAHFYYRLDAVRRDIEIRAAGITLSNPLSSGDAKLMAHRISETLEPALDALEALGNRVPECKRKKFDADAVGRYEQLHKKYSSLCDALRKEAEVASGR